MALGEVEFMKSVCEKYYALGEDEGFLKKCIFHMSTKLKPFYEQQYFNSRREFDECLLSKLFIDKLEFYEKSSELTVEKKEYRAPLIPFEACLCNLNDPKVELRRLTNFYKDLKLQDVLILKVTGFTEKEYEFKVLAKHGDYRKVDDLDICAHLPKCPDEMSVINEELKESDVIQGLVKDAGPGLKIIVTVQNKAVSDEASVKLGKISGTHLSSFINNWGKNSSANFHISAEPTSRIPNISFETYKSLGLDPYMTYSFNNRFQKRPCEGNQDEKIKKMNIQKSNSRLESALEFSKAQDYSNAIDHFNVSLTWWPENRMAYLNRGKMYYDMYSKDKGLLCKKSILDWEKLLDLSRHSKNSPMLSKDYLDVLLIAAKRLIFDKNFDQAEKLLTMLIKDKKNEESLQLLELLNKRNKSVQTQKQHLENISLDDLEAQKKDIVKKLG